MNIKLTQEQVAELKAIGPNTTEATDSHIAVGRAYFFRTVTHYFTGRVVSATPTEVALEDAAWIADTGRFADFLTGKIEPNEVEPLPDGWCLSRGSFTDFGPWNSPLPTEQK